MAISPPCFVLVALLSQLDLSFLSTKELEVERKLLLSLALTKSTSHEVQLKRVYTELGTVKALLEEQRLKYNCIAQPLHARQMAYDADDKAIRLVFPAAKSYPYSIRSFKNLRRFLHKPTSDEFTGPDAPEGWLKLTIFAQNDIIFRFKLLEKKYKFLRSSIETLKDGNSKYAHTITTLDDTVSFYANDTEIVNSVKCVYHFVHTDVTLSLRPRALSESDDGYSYVDGVDLSTYYW